MSDTRKDKRTPLSLKVRFKSATLDEFVEQYSNDISRGGLFIKSKKPMKVGTLLKFEFQLKDESPLIHGVGRVVWRREPDQGGAAGMGIKFIKMDPESRAFVQKIVEERADAPGTFDEGGQPAEPSESFFPGGPAAEQPDPEDRTQVRHASEFLAEALSEGGAAEEAQANADKARARTEEIQREREAAEEARKAEEDAAAKKLAAEEAKRKEAAAAREAKEAEAEVDVDEEEDDEDEEVAPVVPAVVAAEPVVKPKEAAPKLEPAPPRVERAVSARPSPPDESSSSGMLIAIILLICAAGGGYWWWSNQNQTVAVDDIETNELVDEEITAATTIESNVEAEILIDGEARGTTPLDVSLPVGTEVIITARAAGQEQSRPLMVPESFEGPVRFEFEEVDLPWVVTITTTPAGAQLTVDGEAAENELTFEQAPERMEVMATHPGHRSATATITEEDFTLSDGSMVYALALNLEPRADERPPVVTPPFMRAMTTVMEETTMDVATMEATMEAATMEPATMEPATMEPATMEPATMEPATMEPATMEPATMEPATMEPVVPDNPF